MTLTAMYKISADITNLQAGVERGVKSMETLESKATQIGKVLADVFKATAIVSVIKETIDYASRLTDLADQTKLSTTALQKLDGVFHGIGISMDSATNAVLKLQKGLGDGDKSLMNLVSKLGMSFATLKSMAPEQAFFTIADAIGRIPSQNEKALASTLAFGKGGMELLAGLNGHLQESADKFEALGLIIDEKTVAAADNFGDQLGLMGKQLLAIVATIIGPLLPGLTALGSIIMSVGNVIKTVLVFAIKAVQTVVGGLLWGLAEMLGTMADLAQKIPLVGKYLTGLGTAAAMLHGYAVGTAEAMNKLWTETDTAGSAAKLATPKLLGLGQASEEAARKIAAELEKTAAAWKEYNSVGSAALNDIADATRYGIEWDLKRGISQETLARVYMLTKEQVSALADAMKTAEGVRSLESAIPGLIKQFDNLRTTDLDLLRKRMETIALVKAVGELEQATHRLHFGFKELSGPISGMSLILPKMEDLKDFNKKFSSVMGMAFNGLPTLLIQAFTGGGGVGGALKALGTKIGADLFGPEGTFNKYTKSATAGLSSVFGKTIGGALGSAIPGIGALIGPAIQGIGKLFGNMFGMGGPSEAELKTRDMLHSWQDSMENGLNATQRAEAGGRKWSASVIAVRDAFVATGRSADAAQLAVKRALDAKTPEAFQAAMVPINEAFAELERNTREHGEDIARAKELIDEYKLSTDQLGASWRNQQLHEQAQGLMNDWRILVDILGLSVPAATATMKDKLIDYAKAAAKMGTDVPASMRPILQSLIDQGLWLDSNGQAFTDLSQTGVLFGSPLERGLDRIVDRLDTLLRGLGLIPAAAQAAANGVPDNPFADWIPPSLPDGNNPNYEPYNGSGTTSSAASGALTASRASGGSVTVVHTSIQLDGREVAKSVSRHQMDDIRNRGRGKAA